MMAIAHVRNRAHSRLLFSEDVVEDNLTTNIVYKELLLQSSTELKSPRLEIISY